MFDEVCMEIFIKFLKLTKRIPAKKSRKSCPKECESNKTETNFYDKSDFLKCA